MQEMTRRGRKVGPCLADCCGMAIADLASHRRTMAQQLLAMRRHTCTIWMHLILLMIAIGEAQKLKQKKGCH